MGGIPVLNDNQMNALRRVIGTNQKFDLTVAPQGKSRRLPSYPEEEAAASAEYNGYFTLKDVSTRDEQGNITAVRIAVCDGETWDAEHETSGDSYLRVNNTQYSVPCTILTDVSRYIYIQYDVRTSPPTITLISSQNVKEDVDKELYYYLVGELYEEQIIQRHTSGFAQIWILEEEYDGPFAVSWNAQAQKIKVNAGFASCNGEWFEVPSASISPSTGYICVRTYLSVTGTWDDPEIRFANPGPQDYPIGYCSWSGGKRIIKSFRVPVAIFIVTQECSR